MKVGGLVRKYAEMFFLVESMLVRKNAMKGFAEAARSSLIHAAIVVESKNRYLAQKETTSSKASWKRAVG